MINSKDENDLYINTLLNASYLLMQKQSNNQNQIHLPLYDKHSMELDKMQDILQLMQYNEILNYYSYTKKKKKVDNPSLYHATFTCEAIHILFEDVVKEKMLLGPSIKKGISTKIASLTDTTRKYR